MSLHVRTHGLADPNFLNRRGRYLRKIRPLKSLTTPFAILPTAAGTGGCMILHVRTASPVRSCSMQGVDVDKKTLVP